jgi:hypothetical protein
LATYKHICKYDKFQVWQDEKDGQGQGQENRQQQQKTLIKFSPTGFESTKNALRIQDWHTFRVENW